MPKAIIEPLSAIVRVGADDYEHYGDFHFVCSVRYLNPFEVELCGLKKDKDDTKPAMNHADWRAILEAFALQGVRRVMITRVKDGQPVIKWFDTQSKRRAKV